MHFACDSLTNQPYLISPNQQLIHRGFSNKKMVHLASSIAVWLVSEPKTPSPSSPKYDENHLIYLVSNYLLSPKTRNSYGKTQYLWFSGFAEEFLGGRGIGVRTRSEPFWLARSPMEWCGMYPTLSHHNHHTCPSYITHLNSTWIHMGFIGISTS